MITLFEELVLLKEFEKRENALMGKVVSKSQEKEDMQDKVSHLLSTNFILSKLHWIPFQHYLSPVDNVCRNSTTYFECSA